MISFHIKVFIKMPKKDFDSTNNNFSTPFMTFDNVRNEFVFIVKTNPSFGIMNETKKLINDHADLSPRFNRFPDVKNKDDRLVFTNEYCSRLENNSVVMVDIHFEL